MLRLKFSSVDFYSVTSPLILAALRSVHLSLSVLLSFTDLNIALFTPSLLFHMSGPCCCPLDFLQAVFNTLCHDDKASSYLHYSQGHYKKKILCPIKCRIVHQKLSCALKHLEKNTKLMSIQSLITVQTEMQDLH